MGIQLNVQGGRGDVVCAEPVLRYALEFVMPKEKVVIATLWPEFFSHLKQRNRVQVKYLPDFKKEKEEGKYEGWQMLATYENKSRPGRGMIQAINHGVDFASFHLLGYTIPKEHRKIILPPISETERSRVTKRFKDLGVNIRETLLIHPGDTWPTRTLPSSWWEEFMKHIDVPVCKIGHDIGKGFMFIKDSNVGYHPSLVPVEGVPHLEKTDLRDLCVAVGLSWGVLTNDSLPVHLAAAYPETYLFTFSTVKRWDQLKPYGHPRSYNFGKEIFRPEEYCMANDVLHFDRMPKDRNILSFVASPKKVASFINRKYETIPQPLYGYV